MGAKYDVEKQNQNTNVRKLCLKNVSICLNGTQYSLIHQMCSQLNWKSVGENELWNISWYDANVDEKIYQRMKRFQRINHFPCMRVISRKDLLCRNLLRMRKFHADAYNFFPESFTFPADFPKAQQYAAKNSSAVFILKPDNGSQGNGIFITKTLANVDPLKRMICQKYLQNPYLLDGFKFDLRVYVLLTSVHPLRIYVYNEGLVRLATKPYTKLFDRNDDQKYIHLTNYSINKTSQTFSRETATGSKRTISWMNQHFKEIGVNVQTLWSEIDDLIVKTFISGLPYLQHSYRISFPFHDIVSACFELLGFDIILDEHLKPILLEVNRSPSFNLNEEEDKQVKIPLINDTLQLVCNGSIDKRQVLKEDKLRAMDRNSQKNPKIKADNVFNESKISQSHWLRNVEWEENHLGNYRIVMPSKLYSYEKLIADSVLLTPFYTETIIGRNRTVASREYRTQLIEKVVSQVSQKPSSANFVRHQQSQIKTESVKEESTKKILQSKLARKPTGYTPRKWLAQDELNRQAISTVRSKSVASFQIKSVIYELFSSFNLLSKNDKVKQLSASAKTRQQFSIPIN